jgi:hypothetical protein
MAADNDYFSARSEYTCFTAANITPTMAVAKPASSDINNHALYQVRETLPLWSVNSINRILVCQSCCKVLATKVL